MDTQGSVVENRVLWVTGAGSGMGRASAIQAANAGWDVILTGRRSDRLEETAAHVRAAGRRAIVARADVSNTSELREAYETAVVEAGAPSGLVLAAGLNAPQRSWRDQSVAVFEDIVKTNLISVAAAIDVALGDLRMTKGSIVVISSYSAWRFSPGAGVAYSASKAALAFVCESLNDQENVNGVRACHLCPGDVDTEFLEMRPVVPATDARAKMLTADDVARAVLFVLQSPSHVRIDELVIAPVTVP